MLPIPSTADTDFPARSSTGTNMIFLMPMARRQRDSGNLVLPISSTADTDFPVRSKTGAP